MQSQIVMNSGSLTVREGGGYLSHGYEGMTPTHIEEQP